MARSVSAILLAGALVLALPAVALACPACVLMPEQTRIAFAQTAIALTLLPLGLVGGVGFWLRRRVQERDAENAGSQDPQA